MLAQYNDIIPGFAEKIIEGIEEETKHRRDLEHKSFEEAQIDRRSSHELAQRGQIFALVVALAGMSVAGFAVMYDAQWIGSIVGGGTIVALVTAFLRKPTARPDAVDEE